MATTELFQPESKLHNIQSTAINETIMVCHFMLSLMTEARLTSISSLRRVNSRLIWLDGQTLMVELCIHDGQRLDRDPHLLTLRSKSYRYSGEDES